MQSSFAAITLDCFAALAMTWIDLSRSSAVRTTEVKHVTASVASDKHNDVSEQNEHRTEHDHDGRLAHA
jgi:hypothetical protein